MKELSTNTGSTSRKCVLEAVKGKSTEENECLPKEASMKKMVQRARKNKNAPKNPEGRTGFEIESPYTEYCGKPFLRHDSGSDDEKRILIFVTDEGIQDLKTYKNWSADGTFKTAPSIFYQIFSVHVHINETQTVPR